jgi:hypothetical protein
MRRIPILVAVALIVAGCGPASEPTGALSGRLVSGPHCPVETESPSCDDRPVVGATVVVTAADGSEHETRSDDEGIFRLDLPPGTATVTFAPVEGLMGTPAPVSVTVDSATTADLGDVAYDTGIR